MLGDLNMMNVIFRNLLSNAIKYSYKNGIVNVIVKENGPFVQLTVEDSGVGIASEELPELFTGYQYKSTGERRWKLVQGLG